MNTKKPYGFWTKEKIISEFKKYNSFKDLYKENKTLYGIAWRKKLHLIASEHFNKRNHYLTHEEIFQLAGKYKSLKEWRENHVNSYQSAHRRGILKFASKHMRTIGSKIHRCIYKIWFENTKIIYIGLTCNYERRIADHLKENKKIIELINIHGHKNFRSKKITGYLPVKKAIKLEDELINFYKNKKFCVINKRPAGSIGGGENQRKWCKKKIKEVVKNFKTFKEWFSKNPQSYYAAYRLNLLNDKSVTGNLVKTGRRKWNYNNILEKALMCDKAGIFSKNYPSAFQAAIKLNVYRKISSLMEWKKNLSVNERV